MNFDDIKSNLKSGLYILVERKSAKSDVWKQFKQVHDTSTNETIGAVQCIKCKVILSYSSSKTGSSHLKRHVCKVLTGQSRIDTHFTTKEKEIKKEIKDSVTKACVTLCSKDVRPFDIVSGSGFINFAQTLLQIGATYGNLDAKNLLPHPTTVSRNTEKEMERVRNELISKVQLLIDSRSCSATTDMWTDPFKHLSYITLTLHFIDDSWKLNSNVLFTQKFYNDRKTAFNIKFELIRKIKEIGFKGDVLSKLFFVTDQGTNIVCALQQTIRLNCSCHIINTILRNTFKEKYLEESLPHIKLLTDEVKNVVTYLKYTGLVQHLKSTLQQECETRWNSRLNMLESFDANYEDITNILIERGEIERMNHIEQSTLKMLITFLKPFRDSSVQLEGNMYPTLELVLPIRTNLLQLLELSTMDSEDLITFKNRSRQFCIEKFVVHKFHKIALFFWPNFRQLKILSPNEKEEVIQEVRDMLKEYSTVQSEIIEEESTFSTNLRNCSEEPPNKKTLFDFSSFKDSSITIETEVDEVASYMNLNITEQIDPKNLLDWWKNNSYKFPNLVKIVKRVLCIPASSSASERNFSAAGLTLQNRRTSLSSDSVDSILFLHNNL